MTSQIEPFKKQLNENDRWSIINALRAAETVYKDDAKIAGAAKAPRLQKQFEQQAETVKDLAVLLENYEVIVIQ